MSIHLRRIPLVALLVLIGCAGMNPNPGERTADTDWEMGGRIYCRGLRESGIFWIK